MLELPSFDERFRQYGFEWMTRVPGRYSEVLVCEFYPTYKWELQRLYLQGQIWKSGKTIPSLMIRGVRVDIYPHNIGRFLYGPEY